MNVHTCPNCKGNGNVIQQKVKKLLIECPKCHGNWHIDSKVCPKCSEYNGYTGEGLCIKCYSASKSW